MVENVNEESNWTYKMFNYEIDTGTRAGTLPIYI